jgi:hypothetical protein
MGYTGHMGHPRTYTLTSMSQQDTCNEFMSQHLLWCWLNVCAHSGLLWEPGGPKTRSGTPARVFFQTYTTPPPSFSWVGSPFLLALFARLFPGHAYPPRALTAQGGVRANRDVRGGEDGQRRRLLGDEDQDASLDDVCRAVTLGRRGGPAERKKASRVPPISLEPWVATLGVETGSGASGEADEEAAW